MGNAFLVANSRLKKLLLLVQIQLESRGKKENLGKKIAIAAYVFLDPQLVRKLCVELLMRIFKQILMNLASHGKTASHLVRNVMEYRMLAVSVRMASVRYRLAVAPWEHSFAPHAPVVVRMDVRMRELASGEMGNALLPRKEENVNLQLILNS
eukprot:GFUD01099770.1.p1 GENE.GFUD01099770.1~~GFUD01099770.1.p1  ORF type:complete len:153 (-),score=30.47 GFUD01099770.1:92-550(-)